MGRLGQKLYSQDVEENYVYSTRMQYGLSQKALAYEADVTLSFVQHLELGYTSALTPDGKVKPNVARICTVLNTSVEDMFPREVCRLRKDDDLVYEQLQGIVHAESPELAQEDKERLDLINQLLPCLDEREHDLMLRVYYQEETLVVAGEQWAITGTRVHQILSKAERKIRGWCYRINTGRTTIKEVRALSGIQHEIREIRVPRNK